MWSKLQAFEIKLDSADHTFSPGEIITGNAILDVIEPKRLRSFLLRFKGLAKVHWTRRKGSGKRRRTKHYSAEEEYFRVDHYLLGEADGETIELPIGRHTFPFEFCLPHDIPSSFETTHGSIRYTIKAIIDRPWRFDHEIQIPFTVDTPYDLTECSTAMTAIEQEESETLCCFPCFNMGSVIFNVFLPTNGFSIGEAIEAKINFHNTSSSANVTKVKLRLEQVLKLYASSATKTETNVVQKVKEVRRFSKKDEAVLGMQVPSLPYSSMIHCGIIDINYYLNVVISTSGCHCDMTRKYPIFIGTNSDFIAEEENLTPIPGDMPTAPFFPTESEESMDPTPMPYPTGNEKSVSGFSNPIPPYSTIPGNSHYQPGGSLPIGFVPPNPAQASTSSGSAEKPPPSYEEAMDMSGKH